MNDSTCIESDDELNEANRLLWNAWINGAFCGRLKLNINNTTLPWRCKECGWSHWIIASSLPKLARNNNNADMPTLHRRCGGILLYTNSTVCFTPIHSLKSLCKDDNGAKSLTFYALMGKREVGFGERFMKGFFLLSFLSSSAPATSFTSALPATRNIALATIKIFMGCSEKEILFFICAAETRFSPFRRLMRCRKRLCGKVERAQSDFSVAVSMYFIASLSAGCLAGMLNCLLLSAETFSWASRRATHIGSKRARHQPSVNKIQQFISTLDSIKRMIGGGWHRSQRKNVPFFC